MVLSAILSPVTTPEAMVSAPEAERVASPERAKNDGVLETFAINNCPAVPFADDMGDVPFPTRTPLVGSVVSPVPPLATETSVPCHVPLVTVPTVVMLLRLPVVTTVP